MKPITLELGQELVAIKERSHHFTGLPKNIAFEKGDTLIVQGLVMHEGYLEVLMTKDLRSDWESIPAEVLPEYFDIPAATALTH